MSETNTFHLVDDPAFLRKSLTGFLDIRAAAIGIRAEMRETASLLERIAMAEVLTTIDRWIYYARARLAALGLPCNESTAGGRDGESDSSRHPAGGFPFLGCRGVAPAVMAHGCAAVAVDAGASLATLPGRLHNRPDNPLFLGLDGKELPIREDTSYIQTAPAVEKLS